MATDNRCDLCNEHHEEVWYCTTCSKWFCYLCGSTDGDSLCTKCEIKNREAAEPSCDWCGVPCECGGRGELGDLDEVLG